MGLRPAVRFPLWSYKSKLLTPKLKACHHLLTEDFHPLQGDKQRINHLTSPHLPEEVYTVKKDHGVKRGKKNHGLNELNG